MNNRLRHFLNLDGDRQAGPWFRAVLAVGALSVGYSVVTDWRANSPMQRVVGLAALLITAGLTAWPRARSYPINPDDVAHFRARQEERKRTIGHE